MKFSKGLTNVLTLVLSLILFVFGYLIYGSVFESFLPKVEGVSYQSAGFGAQFNSLLIFSLILGLMPVSILLLWRLSPVVSMKKRSLSVLTLVVCITLAIVVRRQMLKLYLNDLTNNSILASNKIHIAFPVDRVKFEYYLVAGLCAGLALSWFLFRQGKGFNSPSVKSW